MYQLYTETKIKPGQVKEDEYGGFLVETDETTKKWATTYLMCSKYQVIDLLSHKIDKEILTSLKPKLEISEKYAARHDCGAEYHLKVVFYDEKFTQLDQIQFDDFIEAGTKGEWKEFRRVVDVLPENIRYLLYHHYGKDTFFWAGHYGIKITSSTIKFLQ